MKPFGSVKPQKITETEELRQKYKMESLSEALIYNEFENTEIYKSTVQFWEEQKPRFNMYREVMYLSKKETYKKYNDTYTDMLVTLKHHKGLEGLHKEFLSFMNLLVKFLNQ